MSFRVFIYVNVFILGVAISRLALAFSSCGVLTANSLTPN